MTEYLAVDGGTIAYEVAGSGPLIVLAHGMGDSREAYRAVVPELVTAGYRVAAVDLRGCGESSVDWPAWSRTDIAGDLLALIRHLGGPAVLVGHSVSGGAATVAAAREPSLVTSVVELAPVHPQAVGPARRPAGAAVPARHGAAARRGPLRQSAAVALVPRPRLPRGETGRLGRAAEPRRDPAA
ncbi:alpha/beta fold hydrolase [Streptomyces sp. SAI-129]|uniref:alpha/beta fold hydrolase n=1 Tax=Streptomyces sp. SAI-129 TaxID=3377727 RepID=UPI003C7C309F